MDVVIPYRRSPTQELMYALRSLKNLQHDKVFIIGDKPSWLSDKARHIRFRQTMDIAANTLAIMNLAACHPEVSEDFIWMPDDVFVMRRVLASTHHRGRYAEILQAYKNRGIVSGYYIRRMQSTYSQLLRMGIKDPLCYELHIPFVVNKQMWNSVKDHIKKDHNKLSMYGNINKIGGTLMRDVKVRRKNWVPSGSVISTHDATFGSNRAGELIRSTFRERSIYEK